MVNGRYWRPFPLLSLDVCGAQASFSEKIAFREVTVSDNVAFRFLAGTIALSAILFRRWRTHRPKDFLARPGKRL
jgi:hypothetical protein